MVCMPKKPLNKRVRIIALILCYVGLILTVVSYFYPKWTEYHHKGKSGYLGVNQMCEKEHGGGLDCRKITGKDFVFILFQGFMSIGMGVYGMFTLTATVSFCTCIRSPKAVSMTKMSVIIFDLITFNCLMIAIITGLKTSFMGTLETSYGSIMSIIAFAIACGLCPVYLIDFRTTVALLRKREYYKKFSDIQETDTNIQFQDLCKPSEVFGNGYGESVEKRTSVNPSSLQ